MDFAKRMLPTREDLIFQEEGYFVWCGAAFPFGGKTYLLYSRWKTSLGFQAWVTDSEICLAVSDRIDGRFRHLKVVLGKDATSRFDADCKHNPTVLLKDGYIYLYYMGNYGDGQFWTHRNHQRIGVAYTNDPEGEWIRPDSPVLDVSDDGFDSLMTSNPTVTLTSDGRVLMVYKGVSREGKMPIGGPVVCGVAFADSPLGPFRKIGVPIMKNPADPWSVEDPFVFREGERYYALVKDFHGYFTKTGKRSVALFTSVDGIEWQPDATPLAFSTELCFEDGRVLPVKYLERPQLYFENGVPVALLCACAVENEENGSFNIRILLKGE